MTYLHMTTKMTYAKKPPRHRAHIFPPLLSKHEFLIAFQDNSAGVQYLQGLPGFGKKSHLFSDNRLHDTLPGQESAGGVQENIRQDANSNGNYRGKQ